MFILIKLDMKYNRIGREETDRSFFLVTLTKAERTTEVNPYISFLSMRFNFPPFINGRLSSQSQGERGCGLTGQKEHPC